MQNAAAIATPRTVFTHAPVSFEEFRATWREPVYVILGVQGSGTNLLRSILVGTFNFAVIQDQSLIYNAARAVSSSPAAIQQQFDFICSRLFPSTIGRKLHRRIKSNASFDGIRSEFETTKIRGAADLARFVYSYAAFSHGTRLVAIKSDDLWETIGDIDTVLPNRRIILLTRDFRDNLLSIVNKDFGPIEPVVAAHYVKQRFSHYEREYARTPERDRIHVRYEDLLEAPDAFASRLADHFELRAAGHTPKPVDLKRIRRSNMKKWGHVDRRELAFCEAILREELDRYGYGTECPPVAAPEGWTWTKARTLDAIRRVPQKVRRVINRLQR
jgi:hypothetical protein